MTDELKAAAENVLAYAALVKMEHCTPLLENAVIVTKALLAEHPANDDEPVTIEELEAALHDSCVTVAFRTGRGVFVGAVGCEVPLRTRGDLRRLYLALGISLPALPEKASEHRD